MSIPEYIDFYDPGSTNLDLLIKDIILNPEGTKLYATCSSKVFSVKIANIDPTLSNNIKTIAGSFDNKGLSQDSSGVNAVFNLPLGLTMDTSGNVFVSDTMNHNIRKIDTSGNVTTFAGDVSGNSGFTDSSGTFAKFNMPSYLAIDTFNNIYVTDTGNKRIRKITPNRNVRTLAGSDISGNGTITDNGQGTSAKFTPSILGITCDPSGCVYVCEGRRIRKIDSSGNVTTHVDSSGAIYYNLTNDGLGNLYISDYGRSVIEKVDSSGSLTLIAGSYNNSLTPQSVSDLSLNLYSDMDILAKFDRPRSIIKHPNGDFYLLDSSRVNAPGFNNPFTALRKFTNTTLPPTPITNFRSVSASPTSITVAWSGGTYSRSYVFTIGGVITIPNPYDWHLKTATFTGLQLGSYTIGIQGVNTRGSTNFVYANLETREIESSTIYVVDTLVTRASLLISIVSDSSGNIYANEDDSSSTLKITPQGTVSTFYNDYMYNMVVDSSNNLFGSRATVIYKIDPTGTRTVFAGNVNESAYVNDTGTAARFGNISAMTIDSSNNLYVYDAGNFRIRKITVSGVVTTIAGDGTEGYLDGPGTTAKFSDVSSITCDLSGNIYVGDKNYENNIFIYRIRKINSSFNVSTIVEKSTYLYKYITCDKEGTIYAACELTNSYIRKFIMKISPTGEETLYSGLSSVQDSINSIPIYARYRNIDTISTDTNGNIILFDVDNDKGTTQVRCVKKATNIYGVYTPIPSIQRIYDSAVDSSGNMYTNDDDTGNLLKITPQGTVSTFFNEPLAFMVVDSSNNLFGVDNFSKKVIYKIDTNGTRTVFAGNANEQPGYVNDTGTNARFADIRCMTIDSSNNLYVYDSVNFRIRKITVSGAVTTIAGDGTSGNDDGPGTTAKFYDVNSITCDLSGNIYVSDEFGDGTSNIRKINSLGVVSTFLSSNTIYYKYLRCNKQGDIYAVCKNPGSSSYNLIMKISPTGIQTLYSGEYTTFEHVNDIVMYAKYREIASITIDNSGNIILIDYTGTGSTIRTIKPITQVPSVFQSLAEFSITRSVFTITWTGGAYSTNHIFTINGVQTTPDTYDSLLKTAGFSGLTTNTYAFGIQGINSIGSNTFFYQNIQVPLFEPSSIYVIDTLVKLPLLLNNLAVDSSGNIYGDDDDSGELLKITPQGTVSTFFNDRLRYMVADSSNNFFGSNNSRLIYKIDSSGTRTVFAGNNESGYVNDTGTNARFASITAMTIDSSNNLYVYDQTNGDYPNYRIRKITPLGDVTTIAGDGTQGYLDGPGNTAKFSNVESITCDLSGNIYVIDMNYENNIYIYRIRKINSLGVVSTILTSTNMYTSIRCDKQGDIYAVTFDLVNETYNTIFKISPTGEETLYSGLSSVEDSINGIPIHARYRTINNISIDTNGNIILFDTNNNYNSVSFGTQIRGIKKATNIYGVYTPIPSIRQIYDLAVDSSGNMYTIDIGTDELLKITPQGSITTLPNPVYFPVVDSSNNLFGVYGNAIYTLDSSGNRILLAGSQSVSSYVNATGPTARFGNITCMTIDSSNNLYVYDAGNFRIRKITVSGVVTTVAGDGTEGYLDGPGTTAKFGNVTSITCDLSGNIYVSHGVTENDIYTYKIRKINSLGVVSTFLSSDTMYYDQITCSKQGDIYARCRLAGSGDSNYIMKISPTGIQTLYSGEYNTFEQVNDIVMYAKYKEIEGITIDNSGNIILIDNPSSGSSIRTIKPITSGPSPIESISPYIISSSLFTVRWTGGAYSTNHIFKINGIVTTPYTYDSFLKTAGFTGLISTNTYSFGIQGENTIGLNTFFYANISSSTLIQGNISSILTIPSRYLYSSAIDSSGNLYVSDDDTGGLFKITSGGNITTFNSGTYSNKVVDSSNNLFAIRNSAIFKINASGNESVFAGNLDSTGYENAIGGNALFSNSINDITIDSLNNLYVADAGNYRIRKITSLGAVTTIAGDGTLGYLDGPGVSAKFSNVSSITCDLSGNIYVIDDLVNIDNSGNISRIRKIDSSHNVSTLISSTTKSYERIQCDRQGNIYAATEDYATGNINVIMKISPTGEETIYSGSYSVKQIIDGRISNARYSRINDIDIDSSGNIFIIDFDSNSSNSVLRKIIA